MVEQVPILARFGLFPMVLHQKRHEMPWFCTLQSFKWKAQRTLELQTAEAGWENR